MATIGPNVRCSTFERIENLSEKLLAKSTIARFADKGEVSKLVARLVERFREAIVCYQVGDCCTSASSIVDKGADIATTIDIPSDHSSHCNTFLIVSGVNAD